MVSARNGQERLIDASAGALLGTFVGDALGMPFEGTAPRQAVAAIEFEDARLGRGTYTDDTQMMIALAESLVEHGRVVDEDLAQRFLAHHQPERGYGSGTLEVFSLWRQGVPVGEAAGRLFRGKGSLGNGASMRIAPIAVRFALEPDRLLDQARRSARLTHAHPLGVDAACVMAAAIGAGVRGDAVLDAALAAAGSPVMRVQLDCVAALVGSGLPPDSVAAELGNSSSGHQSVPTAIYAACAASTFEAAVRFAVCCGGDTDTIAAMAGAVAGARDGVAEIPDRWLEALEDGPRGRGYVSQLAESIAEAMG
jgi:poly(ADP-ribose) glycohydrolase ARH3